MEPADTVMVADVSLALSVVALLAGSLAHRAVCVDLVLALRRE